MAGHHGFVAFKAVAALNVVRSTASFFSAARSPEAPIDEGLALQFAQFDLESHTTMIVPKSNHFFPFGLKISDSSK